MNTIKRFVVSLSEMHGIKKVSVLFVSAFVFALAYMTKGMTSSSSVLALFFALLDWVMLSVLFVTVFDFEKSLKRVFSSLFCFFTFFYLFAYSWFVSLYPLDFAGLGKAESIFVVCISIVGIPVIHSCMMSVCLLVGYIAAKQVKNTYLRAILVSFGYVLGEFVQSLGTFAMPWVRLFVGQADFVELLQSASLLGSYFITFIMVLVNALVAFSLLKVGKDKKKCRNYVCIALALFMLNLGFGVIRVNTADCSECETVDAVVLQGNIPSSEKWSDYVSEGKIYSDLSDRVLEDNTDSADIAVMPETAFPVTLRPDDEYESYSEADVKYIAKKLDTELFVGAFGEKGKESYNSVFVVDADGNFSKPYNKVNLVPFGEFLPYREVLVKVAPVLSEINMISSDLSKGEDFEPIQTKKGKAACLICFDSIFPETSRKQVNNGADYIVISTNDSWYKTSAALYQHADHAVMRAIENDRPVIRSANTGISRIIDSKGRVVAETEVNKTTFIRAEVSLPEGKTLYTVVGDLPVLLGGLAMVLALAYGIIKNKKASH